MAKNFRGPQFWIGFPKVFTEIIFTDKESLTTFCLTFCTDRSWNKTVDWLCKAGGLLLRKCRNYKQKVCPMYANSEALPDMRLATTGTQRQDNRI